MPAALHRHRTRSWREKFKLRECRDVCRDTREAGELVSIERENVRKGAVEGGGEKRPSRNAC